MNGIPSLDEYRRAAAASKEIRNFVDAALESGKVQDFIVSCAGLNTWLYSPSTESHTLEETMKAYAKLCRVAGAVYADFFTYVETGETTLYVEFE